MKVTHTPRTRCEATSSERTFSITIRDRASRRYDYDGIIARSMEDAQQAALRLHVGQDRAPGWIERCSVGA